MNDNTEEEVTTNNNNQKVKEDQDIIMNDNNDMIKPPSNNNGNKQEDNSPDDKQEDDIFMEIDGDNTNNNMDIDSNNPSNPNPTNAIEELVLNSIQSYSLDCYPYTFSPLLLFTNGNYFDKGYSNYNAVAAFFAPALRGLGGSDGEDSGNGGSAKKKKGDGRSSSNGENKNGSEQEEDGAKENDDDGDKSKISNDIDEAMDANEEEEEEKDKGSKEENDNEEDDDDQHLYGDEINMLQGAIYDRRNLTYDELYNHINATKSLVTCCIDAHFTAFQIIAKDTLIYYDPLSPQLKMCSGAHAQNVALYLMMKCGYGDNGHIIENKKYYTNPTSSHLQQRV